MRIFQDMSVQLPPVGIDGMPKGVVLEMFSDGSQATRLLDGRDISTVVSETTDLDYMVADMPKPLDMTADDFWYYSAN